MVMFTVCDRRVYLSGVREADTEPFRLMISGVREMAFLAASSFSSSSTRSFSCRWSLSDDERSSPPTVMVRPCLV